MMLHNIIEFVSDLRQVGSFLLVLQFPPPIKLTTTIYLNYCLKIFTYSQHNLYLTNAVFSNVMVAEPHICNVEYLPLQFSFAYKLSRNRK
jgi:hypothetical protein